MDKFKTAVYVGCTLSFIFGVAFFAIIFKFMPIKQNYGDYSSVNGDIVIHTKHEKNMSVDTIERVFNHELVHYKIDKGLIVIDENICLQYRKEMPYLNKDYSCNEVYAYQLE